jgi:predicted Zn-ribbon and HTH transcriptional regulator
LTIPEIRKKTEKKDDKPAAPSLDITWVNDVWFHALTPTSLVLKPGSLIDKHTESDIALTADGLHIVTYGGAKQKKSLFGGGDKKVERDAQRKAVRVHIAATGAVRNLPESEVRTIEVSKLSDLKLVQPIAKVQESMFAGVPVFGEGRIALFLPLDAGNGQQSYCSLPLSGWRILGDRLKSLYGIQLPAVENGVPENDKSDTMSCFVNQTKVESVRNLIYYEKDSGYELELSGYRCKACGIAVSEEGRKKTKLGGANGKGIAKAKCPKCSAKMGEEPLYRIKKTPETATASTDG